MKRFCIIGTPRSGSQHLTEIILSSMKRYSSNPICYIDEPLIPNSKPIYISDNIGHVRHEGREFVSDTIDERWDFSLNILSKINPDNSVIMKIFPRESIYPKFHEILVDLKKLKFEFIILKRNNIEEQLLSFALCLVTNIWNSKHGTITKPVTIPLDGDLFHDSLAGSLYWFANMLKNFDHILQEYSLNNEPIVYYETAMEDLAKVLTIPINTDNVFLKKQRTDDIYHFVSNADQVKEFIKKLINE